jgi:hypothetical protein
LGLLNRSHFGNLGGNLLRDLVSDPRIVLSLSLGLCSFG